MAEIYTFIPKQKPTEEYNSELNRLKGKLLEMYDLRDDINKEIRFIKDAIILLEKGEK